MHLVQFAVLTCFTIVYVIIVVVLVARLFGNLLKNRSGTLDTSIENEDLQYIAPERPAEVTRSRTTPNTGVSRRHASPDFRRVSYDALDGPQSS